MSPLTGGFDLALQIRQEAIEQLVQAMHSAGVVRHHYARSHNEKRIVLQISSPHVSLITADHPDHRARALLTARVHYHSSSLADTGDLGTSAVADVTVRTVLYVSTGDPAPLAGGAQLVADWQETTRDDIAVHDVPAQVADEVRGALLDFIGEDGGGAFPIQQVGVAGLQVGSLAFRYLSMPGQQSTRALVVGMNVGSGVKGSKADLQEWFLAQDWALGVSGSFVTGKLLDRMRQLLGGLPPPHGAAPVELSQGFRLEHFDVVLVPDKIQMPYRVTWWDRWGKNTISGAAEVSLTIGPAGELQLAGAPWTGQWTQLWTALNDAVRAALPLGTQPGQTSIFSSLQSFASLGTGANILIISRATDVLIRPDGIVVGGTFAVENTSAPPQASIVAFPSSGSPLHRILHGGWSWAPGGQIVRFQWNFGDGHSESTDGTNAQFVTEHSYIPGDYTPCLTITDSFGRTATGCSPLQVLPFNAAKYESSSIPTSMEPNQSYDLSVTMRNTGTTTWTLGGSNSYRLGIQIPQDGSVWGTSLVELPSEVAPGARVTFDFSVTAPPSPDRYDLQWRMLQESVEWFGDFTPNVSVDVADPVVPDTFNFSGFFPPIDNWPKLSKRNAGSNVPVKFSLGGNHGLDVVAPGYPKSQKIPCKKPNVEVAGTDPTSSTGSGLAYDSGPDQYHYNWKTEKAWEGTCRQLVVKLKDGSFHRANFQFT